MKKILTFLMFGFITIVTMAGCRSNYHAPKNHEQASTLAGFSNRKDFSHWIKSSIIQVDQKNTGTMLFGRQQLRLYPGQHDIMLYTEYNDGQLKGNV